MESGWKVWVWLVSVVSRRWVWLVGVGGIYGYGFAELNRFPHITYPYSSCICSFLQQHTYFCSLKKNVFRSFIIIIIIIINPRCTCAQRGYCSCPVCVSVRSYLPPCTSRPRNIGMYILIATRKNFYNPDFR